MREAIDPPSCNPREFDHPDFPDGIPDDLRADMMRDDWAQNKSGKPDNGSMGIGFENDADPKDNQGDEPTSGN